MIAIELMDAKAQQELGQLAARLDSPRDLMVVLGREARNALRSHFIQKDQTEPNRLGGPRSHFWRTVAYSVNAPVVAADGREVRVQVSHPAIAQKVFGGTIRAKRTKFLTIPMTADAHARRASTFEAETGIDLFVLRKGDRAFLAAANADGGVTVHYLLVRSVDQSPDPKALPERGALEARLLRRARSHVDRVVKRGKP